MANSDLDDGFCVPFWIRRAKACFHIENLKNFSIDDPSTVLDELKDW
jgi:hypothetical protein